MISSIGRESAFSGKDKLEELRRMKDYFEEKYTKKHSSYDEERKRMLNAEGMAEGRAHSRFRQKYIEEDMYMCGVYEEVYNQGVMLAYKADFISDYDFMEMCLDPDHKENWITYEKDVPESTLIKDPYMQESHPEVYNKMERSDKPNKRIVENNISEKCVIIEVNDWDPTDYIIHKFDEIDDQSIYLAMGDELTLQLVDGSEFLDELI